MSPEARVPKPRKSKNSPQIVPATAPAEVLARVRRVASSAELLEIALIDLRSSRSEALADDPPSLDLAVATRQRASGDHLHVWVVFELKSDPPVFAVRARYRLVYRVTKRPSALDANAFAELNGVFNAWPFWREVVQASAMRMNVPPPVVPLLKI